jgi:AAA+ ATPase superfamily predicted ATPase
LDDGFATFIVTICTVYPYIATHYDKYIIDFAREEQKIKEDANLFEMKVQFVQELRKFQQPSFDKDEFMETITRCKNCTEIVTETREFIRILMSPEERTYLLPQDRYVHDDDCELAGKLVELCPELCDFYASLYENAQFRSDTELDSDSAFFLILIMTLILHAKMFNLFIV